MKSVAVSDLGKVWCLTSEGMVISFDGVVFRDHPFQGDGITTKQNVNHIMVDKNGALWADTLIPNVGGFLYLYQFDGASWKPFTIKNNAIAIRKIVVDRNNVKWIATDGGLISFDGVQSKQYLVEGFNINQLNTVTVDKNNVIWFSGNPNVQSYDGITCKSYDYQSGAIAVDDRSGIWIGSADSLKLYRNNQVYSYKLPVSSTITTITIDPDNVKWIGTAGKGVFSFDGTIWKNFQKIDGVGDNYVGSSLVDKKGVKWFVTNLNLSSFDGNSWKIYTTEAGVELFIKGMAVDRDDVKWFCTFSNIVSFDGKEWKKQVELPPLFLPTDMAVDHNNIKWLIGFQKVMSYDGKTLKIYSYEEGLFPELSYSIRESGSVVVDMNNRKWFIRANSISILDDRSGAGSDVKPKPFTLLGNYPNPFNSQTVIEFELYSWGPAKLAIFNLVGQKIRELGEGNYTAGTNSVVWDGRDKNGMKVSSGIYLYQLIKEGRGETKKMMFLK